MDFVVIGFDTVYKDGTTAVDYVTIAPRGEALERTKTRYRIKDIEPKESRATDSDSYRALLARWKLIGPAYEAWKAGTSVDIDGTPLSAWSGLTPAQADVLRRMHILTVEHVAEMNGATAQKLPFPNALKLPELARDYLSGRDRSQMAAENTELRERMAALEELLAENVAAKADAKPRGRPRKEAADA